MERITKEEVIERLTGLGYKYNSTDDDFTVEFLIDKCEMYIKNMCNLADNEPVPARLHYYWVDIVCGHFLKQKRDSGKIDEYHGFEINSEIGQIRLGDVFITSGSWDSSPTHRLNVIIDTLLDPQYTRSELTCFRKIKW